jgi:hypothetical protein
VDARTLKVIVAIVSVAIVAATLEPLVRNPVDDGYPLSTYPMFAYERGRTITLAYPIGMTTAGERRVLEPELLGTHEVLQAVMVVDGAVASHEADALCRRIAIAVAAEPAHADVDVVRIVHGTHDTVDLVVDGALGPELDYTRCVVPR